MAVRLDAGVTVRGLIVAADPDAVIGVFLVAADLDRAGMVVLDVVRDADGRFHVDHVAPGTWRLVVRGPQFTLLAERQVRVAGEADVDVGEIELPARVWLHGAVRTPDGGPCGGAVIQNVRNDDDFRFTPSVVSQSDGSFDVYVPTTGRGALLVRRHGFGAAVARLDGVDLASRLDVRLSAEGTLDIRIRLPRPGAEFDWYVQTPDGAVRWQPTEAAANDVPGFDRHIVCPGLAPGPLVVEISSPRSTLTPWKHTANVTVVAGETTTVVVGPER